MTHYRLRLYGVLLFVLGLGLATALTVFALRDNIAYFRSPSEVRSGHYPEYQKNRNFRLGGLVEHGSVRHVGKGVYFRVTDRADFASLPAITRAQHEVTIFYQGILPDLFREGQGVIATGMMDNKGVFIATIILAKHDEKYMPPELAATIKHGVAK